METSFEAPLGAGENNFGHEKWRAREYGGAARVRSGVASYIGTGVHVAIGRNPAVLSSSERLYLDHAATTPLLPEARAALQRGIDAWANPNSPHGEGRAARVLLEEARATIAEVLGWRHDVIFTSGASEAVEIAAKRARIGGRAHCATEHPIVSYAMGTGSTVIPVGADGLVDEAALDRILDAGPALVAIQHVNNETGIIQPLDRLAPQIREAGSLLLVDCAQSAGRLPLPHADFVAACAHKLGGPPGIGVLLVKDLAMLQPSGGQEKGYRRGTQDVPHALAFAAALSARPYDLDRLASLRARLETGVKEAAGVVIGDNSPRIPTIGAISLPSASSASLLVQFDLAGIAVSAGSACSSGAMKGSSVLAAMAVPADIAGGYLRISFGPLTSEADIDRFLAELRRIAERSEIRAA
jgi:cysteine desulfurase